MRLERCAYSLVELLVTVAAIALVVGISIPLLRGAFDRGRDAERIGNIRATMVDFATYAADHDGVAPNTGIPGVDYSSPWYRGMSSSAQMMSMYLAITVSWPLFLHDSLGESHVFWHPPPGPTFPPELTDAGITPDSYDESSLLAMPSEYEYSLTFVTDAALWSGEHSGVSEEAALAFAKNVRFDQASYPSAKGVLIHARDLRRRGVAATAFVDGSASFMRHSDFLPAVPLPLGASTEPFIPVLATKDGYTGRDSRR